MGMNLVCPKCRLDLNERSDSLQCLTCKEEWPVVNGVPYFVRSSEYWGEVGLTQDIVRQIVKEMEGRDWRKVIQDHASPDVSGYLGWLTDFSRVRWHEMLNMKPDSLILDLGAGLGTMSQALAQHYARVFAVEKVEERVEFMRLRFAQEKCANITLIRTDIDLLPFPEQSLDLIVLNGVLEWLPFNKKHMNPRQAQLYYLAALRKLLKPSGTLYVAIENRLSFHFFAGVPDPHIWIRFVPLMPRFVADAVCRVKIGDRYRPYTYSARGYRKLLAEAGFHQVEIFGVFPSYHDPKEIISLSSGSEQFADNMWSACKPGSALAKRILVALDLLKYVSHNYIVLARNWGGLGAD
jgi:SAM-dependent methyltransferase